MPALVLNLAAVDPSQLVGRLAFIGWWSRRVRSKQVRSWWPSGCCALVMDCGAQWNVQRNDRPLADYRAPRSDGASVARRSGSS
jgi:hypothetical protein